MAMDLRERAKMEAEQQAKNTKTEVKGTGRQISKALPNGARKTLADGTVLPPRSHRKKKGGGK